MSEQIHVEVCYALPQQQEIIGLRLDADAQLKDALEQSGLLEKYPEIDVVKGKFGVFGKLSKLDSPLHDGDRVEIYRPLIADPKEARRKRSAEAKAEKQA